MEINFKIVLKGPEKVSSIGGDNASVVVAACKKIVEKDKYKTILITNCIVHQTSILLGEVCSINWINEVIEISKKVTSSILRSGVLNLKFKQIQKRLGLKSTLKIFCSTRFYTIYDVLSSVMTNRGALCQLILDKDCQDHLKPDVKKAILCVDQYENYFSNMEKALNLVREVSNCIRQMERDSFKLSDVTPLFNTI